MTDMNTPICDFINDYCKSGAKRFHMPGHKGIGDGCELDVTEIDGLDSLYANRGVILESEQNASAIFGSYKTCYSTEGSSQCIKAMLHLAKAYRSPLERGYVLASRNVHSSFISASALLDFDIEWLYGKEGDSYICCTISAEEVDEILNDAKEKPFAVFVTSPDYLGNICDISALARVCKKHDVLLLVDNAHGAYLKLSDTLLHPIDLGADMCADSAHKTLPALTGAAYLHISTSCNAKEFFAKNVKGAMHIYGSTSPSFLTLCSLDKLNYEIAHTELKKQQNVVENALSGLKKCLQVYDFDIISNETLKLSICTASYGYTGNEFASLLKDKGICVEFFDSDFVVFMMSASTDLKDIEYLKNVLLSISKKPKIDFSAPVICKCERAISTRQACFMPKEQIPLDNALGRVLGEFTLSCPPAVAIVVCGEKINEGAIAALKHYGTEYVDVIIS